MAGSAGSGGFGGEAGQAGSAGTAGVGGSGGGAAGEGGGGSGGSGGIPHTGGKGGLPCTSAATQYDGQPYCSTAIEDVEVKLFVPAAPGPDPMQLAVYLHGDTANGYYEDWGFEALSAWATAHRVLFFAALAPNGCSWWRPKDTCGADVYDEGYNTEQLVGVIRAVGKAYDVYTQEILFVGYSGGSTFLTRQYVPMVGNELPGVMVLNCGGVDPQPFDWAPSPETTPLLPLHYTFGTDDFMTEYIYPSMADYEAMGFSVDELELPGYGHCDGSYDWDGRTISLWEQRLIP